MANNVPTRARRRVLRLELTMNNVGQVWQRFQGVYPGAISTEGHFMKVKIGIADSSRVVEIEVDDVGAFEKMLEDEFGGGPGLIWFEDIKDRSVGVPKDRIAFVEVDREDARPVGFGG